MNKSLNDVSIFQESEEHFKELDPSITGKLMYIFQDKMIHTTSKQLPKTPIFSQNVQKQGRKLKRERKDKIHRPVTTFNIE